MGYSDERYTITKRKTPENHKRGEEMSGFGTLAFRMLGAIALGQQAGIRLHLWHSAQTCFAGLQIYSLSEIAGSGLKYERLNNYENNN